MRPRLEEIPDEQILSRMEPGMRYTVSRLASRMQCRNERVRLKLLSLMNSGKVKRERESQNGNRNVVFQYFVESDDETVAAGEFEIATPIVINMSGELTSYGVEFERHRALCMTLRRFA
jgi:hypothetical protein